jgi:transcriptional regulator with XRE-family HTH domain
MYTHVVRKKQEPSTDLGNFMRQWRLDERLTVEAAAGEIGVSKSTWSKLERGQRFVSLETLMALSSKTGRPVDELAAKAGQPVTYSRSSAERARRAAALAEKVPRAGALLDLLPELTDRELDTLLSVGESLVRQRQEQK